MMAKNSKCRPQRMILFVSLLAIMVFHTMIPNDAAG